MDITKDNLATALPLVQAAIQSAEFIAFDTEFTGLECGGGQEGNHNYKISRGDTHGWRYKGLKGPASTFRVIQLGIACFRKVPSTDDSDGDGGEQRYVSQGFNLFIWPTECRELSLRPTLTVEVTPRHPL